MRRVTYVVGHDSRKYILIYIQQVHIFLCPTFKATSSKCSFQHNCRCMWCGFTLSSFSSYPSLFSSGSTVPFTTSSQSRRWHCRGRARSTFGGARWDLVSHFLGKILPDVTQTFFLHNVTLSNNNKSLHFCPLGRVSLMIVLVYLLCHSPKLILTFCEIMFKNPKASQTLQLNNS